MPQNAALRRRQFSAAVAFLRKPSSGPSTHPMQVFLADFNAADSNEFGLLERAGFVDAGLTGRTKLSAPLPPARSSSPNNLQARLESVVAQAVYRQLREQYGIDLETAASGTTTTTTTGLTTSSGSGSDLSESFRDPAQATFGGLYPFLPHPAPRHRPRKLRRIDRVYYKTPGKRVELSVQDYELIGNDQPVRDAHGTVFKSNEGRGGFEWPSDHAGVAVTLEWPVSA